MEILVISQPVILQSQLSSCKLHRLFKEHRTLIRSYHADRYAAVIDKLCQHPYKISSTMPSPEIKEIDFIKGRIGAINV